MRPDIDTGKNVIHFSTATGFYSVQTKPVLLSSAAKVWMYKSMHGKLIEKRQQKKIFQQNQIGHGK